KVGKERTCRGDGTVPTAMEFAELRRSGAGDVNLFAGYRAVRGGKLQGIGVNDVRIHAFWLVEFPDIAITGQGRGTNHEVRPDGPAVSPAGKAEVAVVVKADPDDADEVVCEAGKPAVA